MLMKQAMAYFEEQTLTFTQQTVFAINKVIKFFNCGLHDAAVIRVWTRQVNRSSYQLIVDSSDKKL